MKNYYCWECRKPLFVNPEMTNGTDVCSCPVRLQVIKLEQLKNFTLSGQERLILEIDAEGNILSQEVRDDSIPIIREDSNECRYDPQRCGELKWEG